MKKRKPDKEQDFFDVHYEDLKVTAPFKFLLLCRVLNVKPTAVLTDFMSHVGKEIKSRSDAPRAHAETYVLSCGYGQGHYTREDVAEMMHELDALRIVWPDNEDPIAGHELVELYSQYRQEYYKHWYAKWYYKLRRKGKE